jgi:hypothetical protein
MKHTVTDEVDRNYEAFLKLLPAIDPANRERFALMKDQKILGFYSSAEDARTAAETFIKDGLYSIQQATEGVIDLGFFNYAVPVDQL